MLRLVFGSDSKNNQVFLYQQVQYQNIENGVDVCDGVQRVVKDTNPFKSGGGASVNPFQYYGTDTVDGAVKNNDNAVQQCFEEGSLVKGKTGEI